MNSIYFNKTAILILCCSIFVLPAKFVLAETTTVDDVKKEMSELANVLKDFSADKRDDALTETAVALNALDAEIDKLEWHASREVEGISMEVREKRVQLLKKLRKKRNQVAEWNGAMKHSTNEAWKDIKSGFIESYGALVNGFVEAKKEFDKK